MTNPSLIEILLLLYQITLAGFAGGQLADTWTNGSVFKEIIDWFKQAKKKATGRLVRKICELPTCAFCLAHWAVLACLVALWSDYNLLHYAVYWFAGVRISVMTMPPAEVVFDETAQVDDIEMVDDD